MIKSCGLLVDSLSAWTFGDCFQVNISGCGLYAVNSKSFNVLCWRLPKDSHFACSVALLQLSSDSALFISWLPGVLRQGIRLQGGIHCLRWCGMWQVGCTLLWASTMASALAVLLIGIQEACDVVDAVSCPPFLELLIPGSPGQGTDRPTTAPGCWLLGWEDLCVSIWHQSYLQVWLLEHWARCTSRYSDVLSCIIPSRGRLGNHVLLKEGHVLLS